MSATLRRGTRVVSLTELQNVTSDARAKDRFVLIDAVGIVDQELPDPQTLERKRTQSFKQLLESVAMGVTDADTLSSLAGRLSRLGKLLGAAEQAEVRERSGGLTLPEMANRLLDAAVRPLASNPDLRARLAEMGARHEQAIDEVSQDRVLAAGFSAEGTARALVRSFEEFIAEHKDEITALQIIYSIPRASPSPGRRGRPEGSGEGDHRALTFDTVKQLADILSQPPSVLTTESLWRAYAELERDRLRGAGTGRVLTDLVSLVRHAVLWSAFEGRLT